MQLGSDPAIALAVPPDAGTTLCRRQGHRTTACSEGEEAVDCGCESLHDAKAWQTGSRCVGAGQAFWQLKGVVILLLVTP